MLPDPIDLPLVPPSTDKALPPVHVAEGRALPDPWVTLGLPHGTLDPDAVRAAFRARILAHPPEADPRGAERVRLARDRLLDPAQVVDREIGILYVPDRAAWDLPAPAEDPHTLSAEARLLGQLALYTLVEEALWTEGLGALYDGAITALRAAELQRPP